MQDRAAPSSQAWLCWLQALTSVILKSTSSTMMGLEKELKEAAASLQRSAKPPLCLRLLHGSRGPQNEWEGCLSSAKYQCRVHCMAD